MFAQVMDGGHAMSALLASIWSLLTWGGFLGGFAVLLILSPWLLGMVMIDEREVGVVIKKFGFAKLPPGQLIALNGEAGFQADTLAPGLHFGYWFFQYRVMKAAMIRIPAGEIGLVLANAGAPILSERILAKAVHCDNFQDARAFPVERWREGPSIGNPDGGYLSNQHGHVHRHHRRDGCAL